ncbi:YidB family protein [Acidomonas methanolica]|uniref:YidB family protein n=1 Tax=Acidomonas methanolica TaxID=437 RepID=UPI00312C8444
MTALAREQSRKGSSSVSGFFGNLVNSAVGALGAQFEQKFGSSVSEFIQGPGLQTLLDQARKSGLEDKVHSWIGSGENLPISADELRSLLTSEQVETLVSKTGLPAAAILPALAELLPKAVDQHTPDGTAPNGAA